MTSFERYQMLEQRLLRGRALATLSGEIEDRMLNEMDGLWYAMSEAERAILDTADTPTSEVVAPEMLGLIDTDFVIGGRAPIRRAA